MKIVGWLWIKTWFALLHHYILPLCPVECHYTLAKFPFIFHLSLTSFPQFLLSNEASFFSAPLHSSCSSILITRKREKMNLSQIYFSIFTIIWNLWHSSSSLTSYQGCYGPTETFPLPPVQISMFLGIFVNFAMYFDDSLISILPPLLENTIFCTTDHPPGY